MLDAAQSRAEKVLFDVLPKHIIDPKRFGETMAVNRGMLVKAFDHLADARAWLQSQGPSR